MLDMDFKRYSPWIKMDFGAWESVLSEKAPVQYQRRSTVFSQGQPAEYVYLIRCGRVKITVSQPNGTEKQIYFADRGAMCGEIACLQQHAYDSSATAETDSLIYPLSHAELMRAVHSSPAVCDHLLMAITRKADVLYRQIIELSFFSSTQRTAFTLLNLVNEYGVPDSEGVRISIRFTHDEMASLINTSRITVSNVFSRLFSMGVLKKVAGYYIVLRPELLKSLVEALEE